MKGQVLAIMLVIAAGVATFVMSMCAYNSLVWSKETFYREFRFADVFSTLRRAVLLSPLESRKFLAWLRLKLA